MNELAGGFSLLAVAAGVPGTLAVAMASGAGGGVELVASPADTAVELGEMT